jgi:hypothetical protein
LSHVDGGLTLEIKWKKGGFKVLMVAHTPDDELNTGCIQRHTPCMYTSLKLTAYEIFRPLYMDDSAFPFPTSAALIKGLSLFTVI